jgi:hypothetical protein
MPSIFGTTTSIRTNRDATRNSSGNKRGGHDLRKKFLLIEEEPNVKRMLVHVCVIICCGVILYFTRSKAIDDISSEL